MDDAEAQLKSFIAKFADDNRRVIVEARSALKAQLSDCAELVWDNYYFFVIGYSPTERPSDYIVSIAASARGVSLSFNNGAQLSDPDGVLLGSSKVNRYIRLPSADVLSEPAVEAMLQRAVQASPIKRPWSAAGKLVIRSISAKQRPRRRP